MCEYFSTMPRAPSTAIAVPLPPGGRLELLHFALIYIIKTKNKSSDTNMAKPIDLHYRMQTTEYLN